MRPEVADAGLHVQLAVWADCHQAVKPDRPGAVGSDRDADATHFRSATLAGVRLPLVPPEGFLAFIERLDNEGTCQAGPLASRADRTVYGLANRRVDLPDLDLVDPKLLGRLRDERLNHSVGLHRSRRALLRPRRRVGQDADGPPPHRRRLVDDRRGKAGGPVVAHRPVRSVVLDDKEIERGDAAVFREARLHPTGHIRARAADVAFVIAADPHHDRRIRLLREQRGNGHRHRSAALAAETTAGVLRDQHDLRRLDADPSRDRRYRLRNALRGTVQVELAVLPVRHRAAGFHGMVPGGLHDEGLVEHNRGALEAGIEVAVRPFLPRLADRQAPFVCIGELLLGPFDGFGRRGRVRPLAAGHRRAPCISGRAGVRPAGAQALQWINDERHRFEIDVDPLHGFGGRYFVDGSHREDRLAGVERFVGQRFLRAAEVRQIVRRQDRLHAGHRERSARVDTANACVRHRADEELAEQHAIRAKVLRVARAARDLRHEIGRRVVVANELVLSHHVLRMYSPPRMSDVRILS